MNARLPMRKNQQISSFISASLRNKAVRKNDITNQHRFISCNEKKQSMLPISWGIFNRNFDDNAKKFNEKISSTLYLAAALTLTGSTIAWNHNGEHPYASNEQKLLTPPALKENMDDDDDEGDDEMTTLLNWSGTHKIELPNDVYHQPESTEELQSIVEKCYKSKTPIRPLGSALSPNGIGFHSSGMVSLAYLDDIIEIDKENMIVTVQAGARVSQVIEALRPHNLTLPNLASIAEQQMGGFVQVGAHGTGALIPPVDEFVTKIKIISPSLGPLTLEKNAQDEFKSSLFPLAKVGLGCLGVVSEITMQCIPAHNLVEHTYVLTRSEAKKQINTLLKKHKHIRYMWIPYEDTVVVVTNDPEDVVKSNQPSLLSEATRQSKFTKEEEIAAKKIQYKPLTDLLSELTSHPNYKGEKYSEEMISGMGFGEMRDALLAIDPLNPNHVKVCNAAEANFWKNSEGVQIKPSDQLLQFDCGGQQWVSEVCFPTGTYETNNNNDMVFMENLLKGIEENQIAAHSPIEQRWTASSSSSMSPAYGPSKGLHCWVGIIMYLPSDQEKQRKDITDTFKGQYCDLLREVGKNVNATSHWAKLEMPKSEEELNQLQTFMKQRFPVEKFNAARKLLDDENLLANDLLNAVFGSN